MDDTYATIDYIFMHPHFDYSQSTVTTCDPSWHRYNQSTVYNHDGTSVIAPGRPPFTHDIATMANQESLQVYLSDSSPQILPQQSLGWPQSSREPMW